MKEPILFLQLSQELLECQVSTSVTSTPSSGENSDHLEESGEQQGLMMTSVVLTQPTQDDNDAGGKDEEERNKQLI